MEFWDLYFKDGRLSNEIMLRGKPIPAERYHLVIHFWLKRPDGTYLIQKRSALVESAKGFWAITGGSTISGENSLETVIREVEEEVGYVIQNPNELFKIHHFIHGQSIVDIYWLEKEVALNDFKIGPEVDALDFKTASEIREMIKEGIFVDYGDWYFDLVLSFNGE